MIALLALVGILIAGALVAIGVTLHRDLAQIHQQLEQSGHQPEFNRWMDQLWQDVQQLHDGHTKATDARLRDIETTLTQVKTQQNDVVRHVKWMTPWVQRWAHASADEQR